jgi:hypothetical protein
MSNFSPEERSAGAAKPGSTMNRFEKFFGAKNEARVRYLDGEFQVLSPGDFVRCSVTGEQIALTDLKYWSVERQEPYAGADVSLQRHLALRGKGRKG